MDFWERLKNQIKTENTTQEWVAKKTDVSYRTFRGWMSKRIMPNADQATAIAKALGTTVEYLVTGESPEEDLLYSRIQADPKLKELAEIVAMLPENRIDDLIVLGKTWLTADTQSKERHA